MKFKKRHILYVLILFYFLLIVYIKFTRNIIHRGSILMTKEALNKNPELIKNLINIMPFRNLSLRQAIINLLLISPLGVFISFFIKSFKKSFCIVLVTCVVIESLQYILSYGVADINDIIFGIIGGCMGLILLKKIDSTYNITKLN